MSIIISILLLAKIRTLFNAMKYFYFGDIRHSTEEEFKPDSGTVVAS